MHNNGNTESPDQGSRLFRIIDDVIQRSTVPLTLVDARAPDTPILSANEAFRTLTGYRQREIVGRNCRFLQGAATAAEHVRAIKQAVSEESEIEINIANYRKDGSVFLNNLFIFPIYDSNPEEGAVFFVGTQYCVREFTPTDIEAHKDQFRTFSNSLLGVVQNARGSGKEVVVHSINRVSESIRAIIMSHILM